MLLWSRTKAASRDCDLHLYLLVLISPPSSFILFTAHYPLFSPALPHLPFPVSEVFQGLLLKRFPREECPMSKRHAMCELFLIETRGDIPFAGLLGDVIYILISSGTFAPYPQPITSQPAIGCCSTATPHISLCCTLIRLLPLPRTLESMPWKTAPRLRGRLESGILF